MAQASLLINYSVDGAGSVAVPSPFINQTDSATISGFTGTAITLVDGVSTQLQIGVLNFQQMNDYDPWSPTPAVFDVTRTLTINNLFTGSLQQSLTITLGNSYDSASVNGGQTTTISLGGGEFVDVSTIGFNRNTPGGNVLTNDPIYANFLLRTVSAPEPESLSLLVIGMLGMFAASRRRKQDKARI
jgi:hypothetical protein